MAKTITRTAEKTSALSMKKLDFSKILEVMFENFSTGLLLVAAFLIGVLWTEVRYLKQGQPAGVVAGAQNDPQVQPAADQPAQAAPLNDAQWKEVLQNPAAEVGKSSAEIVMVEYSDFQCPYCSRHYTETYTELVKKYVDSGKMRIVFRDLPLQFHSHAKTAAVAARCAGEQGKYVEMHDALFAKQTEWTNLTADEAKNKFKEYAVGAGVQAGQFNSCIDTNKYAKAVEDDLALAQKLGATGTPTFFINKEKIVGALPLASFEAKIDALLK